MNPLPRLNRVWLNAWEYSPTLLDGVPVPVIMTVTVSFRIS